MAVRATPPIVPVRQSERHLRKLALARECAQQGARLRTIEILVDLNQRQILDLLHADRRVPQRGRPPDSPEWYHGGTLLDRTEASVFASLYHRLRKLDFEPTRALLGAYRHYRGVCRHAPRLSFDRAFDLARRLDGIWNGRGVCFSLVTCPDCGSEYLAEVGARTGSGAACPFCKLVSRYPRDPRVQMSFPIPPLPDPACLQWSLVLKGRLIGECN